MKLYPTLDIDPHTTVVAVPTWQIVGDDIVELPIRYETLAAIIAARVVKDDSSLFIEGLHYLTRLPITFPEVHLPVRIDQIGRVINELVPTILPAYQEKQLAYWNASQGASGPRWHELSRSLRKLWDVSRIDGWTTEECKMARQLYLHPDVLTRKGPYDSHAYLVDIEDVDGETVRRLEDNSIVVLIGLIDNEEVILAHSLLNGYQKFESREALGQSLPPYLGPMSSGKKIRWRLYEPDGDIFDNKACGVIAMQVKILGSAHLQGVTPADAEPQPGTERLQAKKSFGEAWFERQVPPWLQAASISDQTLFAQCLRNLSALSNAHAGKTYLDDIPSIKDYASSALKKLMQAEHDDASTLDPHKIQIEIRSPVLWGSFVVPGQIDTTTFSVVELALQNLIALPLGNKSIRSTDDSALPKWMTVEYVEGLISQIDVGRVYPELVKQKLLDDPAESARREQLYIAQLRIQLPMLALENKLRGQGNLNELGVRYVMALMDAEQTEPNVDGQRVVMRKLTFVPELQLTRSEDVVTNMFVIGPKDPSAGPCLLYRPLLEPQLSQFPSFSNLLYAIRQTPSLRQSVLAWLPDGVRETYSRYVFSGPLPSPWTVVEFAVDPLTSFAYSGPVSLVDDPLDSDFMPLLFKANANALVELADRQSVSNSESRWETFKQTGWLIFNLALPYLGSTVGNAVWLWQILDDVEKLTERDEASDSQAKWQTFVDLLLNMALATLNVAIEQTRKTGRGRRTEAPEVVPAQPRLPKPELIIEKLASVTHAALAVERYETVHTSGALMSKSWESGKLLETFSIEAPKNLGQPKLDGPTRGLYEQNGTWYAKVAQTWFNVNVTGDQAVIIDAKQPSRMGPALWLDTGGQWHIETRLQLRGAGSKGARQQVVSQARRRSIQLMAELNQFEERKTQDQKQLTMEAQAFDKATGTAREARRDEYVNTLKTQRERYEEALKILTEWPVFQSRADSPRTRLGYLNAQVNFTFVEMEALGERFAPAMIAAMDMITSGVEVLEQQHVDAAENMIKTSDDMIERLDYMETRFAELKQLGREGFGFVRQHRRKMPVFNSNDLRLIQLDMYRHLCLSLESVSTMPEGWAEINQVVDNATVAFQSLIDAVDERSVIRLDEQINAFGSLTEQFTAIAEHLDYLGTEYAGSASPGQINRMRARIIGLKKRTLGHLARALDERSNRRTIGSPYEERPRPRKRFIRARYWGLISGEPRLSNLREETDWVDVKNPFSDATIASFHRKETGEWVPHVMASRPLTVPVLATSISKGQALIDGLPAFKAQLEKDLKRPHRTPAGIGMIINAHAGRMEKVGNAIDKALEQAEGVSTNETTETPADVRRAAESLRKQLKLESQALYALEFQTVLNIIKQSPPTMEGVIWLKDRNQITITKQLNRQRRKTPPYGYLDRYQIKDRKTNKTLWFADFRYSTDWVPARTFLSARLKTLEQIDQVVTDASTRELDQRQLIALYRSEIAVDQAQQVFFPKEKS
ncbi:dermonecrotic toxin domain-containing protein [Pseudomonas sp. Z1-6]|uniref:dermonecrotic toxin domain-containing protein n=1 Tax=unclassified Pseudomonas TaxID=196821 RepID=UPI003DA7F07A